MKPNEILKAITGTDKTHKEKRDHCKTLSEIYKMINEIKKDIVSVSIETASFNFGRNGEHDWNSGKWKFNQDGELMPGELFTIKTKTGTYKQVIPLGNSFYFAFRLLLSDFLPMAEQKSEQIADFEFSFNHAQSDSIRKAASCVSDDELRPAMMQVRIELGKDGMKVISTDAIRLFNESNEYPNLTSDSIPQSLIINIPGKAIQKTKKKELLTIELFKDNAEFKTGKVNGVQFDYVNDTFPDYKNVIPEYDKFVELNRADLIDCLKVASLCANKVTHRINLHFNGNCEITAEELDYNYESKSVVSYSKKTIPDFEISFNAKYLIDCLNVNKQKEVRIYSDGNPQKLIQIDNNVLLCSIMPNNY